MFVVPVPVLPLRSEFGRLVLVVVMVEALAVGGRLSLLNSSIQRRCCGMRWAATGSRRTAEPVGKVLIQRFRTARRAESSAEAFLVLFPVSFAELLLVVLLRRYLRLALVLERDFEAVVAVHEICIRSWDGRSRHSRLVHQRWTRRGTGRSWQPNVRERRTFDRFCRGGLDDWDDVLHHATAATAAATSAARWHVQLRGGRRRRQEGAAVVTLVNARIRRCRATGGRGRSVLVGPTSFVQLGRCKRHQPVKTGTDPVVPTGFIISNIVGCVVRYTVCLIDSRGWVRSKRCGVVAYGSAVRGCWPQLVVASCCHCHLEGYELG